MINNYNQNKDNFIDYGNNIKKLKENNPIDIMSQRMSFNNNSLLLLPLNPLYISSRRKIFNNRSNNSSINLYLRKKCFQFNFSNNSWKNSDSRRIKKIMRLKNSLNKNEKFNEYETPIFKIKK